MSAITYSINKIMLAIPKQILELAFMSKTKAYGVNTTLSKQIKDLVLDPIVLTDLNVISNRTLKIPLEQCNVTEYMHTNRSNNLIINVPYTVTDNNKIVAPLSLTINGTEGITPYGNPLTAAVDKMTNGTINNSIFGSVLSDLELIGPNTILVRDNVDFTVNGFLEVIIENSNNLSNIKPKSYIAFSKLAISATKMYIYNNLILEINDGTNYYGFNISKVGDIIEGWESASQDYDELLQKFRKILFMNDAQGFNDHIKLMISPNI